MKPISLAIVLATTLVSGNSLADHHKGNHKSTKVDSGEKIVTVAIQAATQKGPGASLGEVVVHKSEYGLIFAPSLAGLSPGLHGFHLHENPDCNPSTKDGKVTPAGAAGGHYDPKKTGHHDAPWGQGHLGDLPALFVAEDGTATRPVLAPRLTADDLKGKSLMIHAGGDNYSDDPEPLGGGAGRIACGVIEK